MSEQRVRRTTYVIDRRFQLKYTGIIVAIGAIIALVCAYFILLAWRDNTELLAIGQSLHNEIVRRESSQVYWVVGIFILLEVVGLFLWGILVTHRIAGPLFIIDRYLGILRSGVYPDMRPLRRHDELQQFFGSFTSAVDAMRTRDEEELKALDAAIAVMADGEVKQGLKKVRDRKHEALTANEEK